MFNVALSTINYHLTQIDESGEVQLSTAIRKIRIPSDNCDEQGVLLFMAVIPQELPLAIPALPRAALTYKKKAPTEKHVFVRCLFICM